MKPVIGITCRHFVGAGCDEYRLAARYIEAVEKAGGIPLVLPAVNNRALSPASICQGLLFSGGGDPEPGLYGEEEHPRLGSVDRDRDYWEIHLVRRAVRQKIAVFGICRGLQVINVALGGTLYQDLPAQAGIYGHSQDRPAEKVSHRVWLEEGTLLHKIMKRKRIWTNSLHHQAVKEVAPGLVVSARTADGVVEALELPGDSFFLSVQWHPERLAYPGARKLFTAFVKNAAGFVSC